MKKLKSIILLLFISLSFILITNNSVYAKEDTRTVISEIEGESSDIDLIPAYGGNIIQPTIDVTTGYPAYFYTNRGIWQKKSGNNWENVNQNEKFRAGIWRYSCNIYIDVDPLDNNNPIGETHRLSDNIKVSVNGAENKWTAEPSTINEDSSYTRVYSKEYVISEPDYLVVYDSNKLDIGVNKATISIQEFSISSCVEGGTKPYIFSKKSGPSWIKVSNDGTISGTPLSPGKNEDLVIQISDSSAEPQTKTLNISVAKTEVAPNLRENITEIVATSNNIGNIPKINSRLAKPQIITDNNHVYFYTDDVIWQKKELNGQQWSNKQPPEKFSVGIWRYSCTIRVENNDEYSPTAGDTHKLSDNTKVKVNGEDWEIENIKIGSNYSNAQVYSKEYYITEPGTFMVLFNTNGGNFVENQIVEAGSKAIQPKAPIKPGYVFDGWYSDKELKNVFNFNTSIISSHTTIYAKWHKHSLLCIEEKLASCKAAGNSAYYKCTTCNKIYKDKNGTQEIKIEDTVLPIISHELKDVLISKEKTKATLTKNGKIIRHFEIKCTNCGEVFGTNTTTEKVYYAKTIKLAKKSFEYNKKVQIPIVIVKDSKGNIIDESNYTISYSNKKSKKVGEYTVTIKFKNKYKGTKKLKYTIKPQGTIIKKLKTYSKQFKAIWNKNTNQTTGYQIQYATNSKFTKNSSKQLIDNNKKTTLKIKELKTKKKYFVRIRTYKNANGKKFYSSWSEVKTVKTKK